MKLYIVIPNYIISHELEKLSRETYQSFKRTSDCTVINVDDGGTQGIDGLKENSDIYIRQENKGFAPACNRGFKWILDNEKKDCYIVCSNNDILVYNGWFDEFKKAMKQFNAGMIGGLGFKEKIIEGKPIEEYRENVGSPYQWNYVTEGGKLNDWMFPGGFYMTKKSVLEDVGLYDEGFIHGGWEDIDLFMRAKQKGHRLIMTPKVQYWHKEGATRFFDEQKGIQVEVEPHNQNHFKSKWGNLDLSKIFIDNRINP